MAPSPHAISSPLSTHQFSNPEPTCPSLSLVAQMTNSFHRQPSLPTSVAASPISSFSTLTELDEITFTGQSPMPFSIPSTPQPSNHDAFHHGAMAPPTSVPARQGNVPDIASGVIADDAAIYLLEACTMISMPLSVNDGLAIDQGKLAKQNCWQTLERCKEVHGQSTQTH